MITQDNKGEGGTETISVVEEQGVTRSKGFKSNKFRSKRGVNKNQLIKRMEDEWSGPGSCAVSDSGISA